MLVKSFEFDVQEDLPCNICLLLQINRDLDPSCHGDLFVPLSQKCIIECQYLLIIHLYMEYLGLIF